MPAPDPTIVYSSLDAQLVSDLVSQEPALWQMARILKKDARTTVTMMSHNKQSVVVKHHEIDSWRHRADIIMHGSPARRSWRGARLLQTYGFSVPQPLAVVEKRTAGMVQESLYVSEALPYPPLSTYWREQSAGWSAQQRRMFLGWLAEFVQSFHAAGLYSGDLRDANLLVEESNDHTWRFCLVDLDRVKHEANMAQRRRIKNLVQLDRTLGQRVRLAERLFFLYRYLGSPLPPPRQRRRLIKKILSLRDRKDREYAKRRARQRPYVSALSSAERTAARQAVASESGGLDRPPISCCIICFNEERNMRRCLESVKWCDEIIVVDSFSTDKTVQICRSYPTRIIQRPWPGYVEQKRFALSQATHEWVLNVDADEEVAPSLQHEIQAVLQRDDPAVDGFYVPRLVRYLGRWWWRGWYPGYRLRLFRKTKVRWGGINPHEKVLLRGHADQLYGNLHHYTYDDIRDHLRTINSLTDVSARELALRKRPRRIIDLLLRPLWRFVSFYFLRGCLRDGIPGFFISVTSAFYVFLKYAKLREQTASSPSDTPAAHSPR